MNWPTIRSIREVVGSLDGNIIVKFFGMPSWEQHDAEREFVERALNSHDDLLGALEAAFVQTDDDVFYRTAGGISQDVPERIARKVRLAFAKVKKGKAV